MQGIITARKDSFQPLTFIGKKHRFQFLPGLPQRFSYLFKETVAFFNLVFQYQLDDEDMADLFDELIGIGYV